jgi:hypothetical protein
MNFHHHISAVVIGFVILWVVLLDAFETVVLPRRVMRNFKLTAYFYRRTWIPWRRIAQPHQENFAPAELSRLFRTIVVDFAAGILGDPD